MRSKPPSVEPSLSMGLEPGSKGCSAPGSEPLQASILLDSLPEPLWYAFEGEGFPKVNRAWRYFTGRAESLAADDWIRDVHPADRGRYLDALHGALHSQASIVTEFRLLHRIDGYRWMVQHAGPVYDENGCTMLILGSSRELGVRGAEQAFKHRISEQLRLWAEVFEHSGEGIFITDARDRIISVNRAFTRITGFAPEDVLGKRPHVHSSRRHDRVFYKELRTILERFGHWQGEIWHQRRNGEAFPAWVAISNVENDGHRLTHRIVIFSDISERKAAQERIQYLAQYDFLTGLPNKNLFSERLDEILASARKNQSRLALLLLDLDRFQTINDSLGHAAGDRLLGMVAERLDDCVRRDDMVSRPGGDEFVILMPHIKATADAARVADKIAASLACPFQLDGRQLNISVSQGISLYPDDGLDQETLLKHADAALFHAKQSGRNQCQFFSQEMIGQAMETLVLENHLRQALDREELTLFYQPQVDIRSGLIVGSEALLRWRQPELGVIPPARFIPLAEETGLITALGEWVLAAACAQNRHWQDAGLPAIPVAVNLSATQFRHRQFQQAVKKALNISGLEPQFLELELTEGVVMHNVGAAIGVLKAMKDLGLNIAIDDFGTGYSSLGYLKRFPIDKLKIDQCFVQELGSDPDNEEITRAIIGMAHSLRLKVIAEGVEAREQLALLSAQHCDEIQGYYFSHPLPPDEFEHLLRSGRRLDS